MSKSSSASVSGSGVGGSRGDVSFIRAVQGASGSNMSPPSQGVDKFSGVGGSPQHQALVTGGSHGQGQSSQHPMSHQRLPPHDLAALQPHLYHPKQQQQQHVPSQHQQQQVGLPSQHHPQHSVVAPYHSPGSQQHQYLPEHMEAQQYHFKHPAPHHGAGGASGEPRLSHTDGWSDREEALAAELEEAKTRVAQMEKTMRWWSDCTSNWREKWNKARGERNKAKDENRILRAKLEALAKEVTRLRRERKEALAQEKDSATPLAPEDQDKSQQPPAPATSAEEDHQAPEKSKENQTELSEKERTVIASTSEKECESLDDLSEASSSAAKHPAMDEDEKDVDDKDLSSSASPTRPAVEKSAAEMELSEKVAELQEELAQLKAKASRDGENAVMMQRKLDEANNTIQAERLEKCSHVKTVEQLQADVKSLQSKLEEETHSKEDLTMQLDKVKVEHQDELSRLTLDLEDEASSRSTMDKRVSELRRDLERIQAENASEWAKRERLESEKLALERDNKKLRAQVSDLEEELEKRSQASSSLVDSDIKTLQFELTENQKELSEVRHTQGKLRKALGERSTELEHTRRRAEQYQEEVRKLRGRVEELKHDLAAAEDEVDKQGNAARKAQRSSDELQAQVDSLQVQVNHLQSRLRNTNKLGPVSTPRSTSLKSLTLDDTADLADSENDFDDDI